MILIRSTKEPALARVIGYSELGDGYRRINFWRDQAQGEGETKYKQIEVRLRAWIMDRRHRRRFCFMYISPPKAFLAPVSAKPPTQKAKPPPKGAPQNIPVQKGEHA